MPRRLLVVHHSPTAATRRMTDAVLAGAAHPDISDVVVVARDALGASIDDVRAADGIALGTPVNFGYMSGALKHFFDRSYRALIADPHPMAAVVWAKGTTDASGAIRSILPIIGALRWTLVAEPLAWEGDVDERACDAAAELGAILAATLDG